MKIKCPYDDCRSENLDQGTDDTILCHECKRVSVIVPKKFSRGNDSFGV